MIPTNSSSKKSSLKTLFTSKYLVASLLTVDGERYTSIFANRTNNKVRSFREFASIRC